MAIAFCPLIVGQLTESTSRGRVVFHYSAWEEGVSFNSLYATRHTLLILFIPTGTPAVVVPLTATVAATLLKQCIGVTEHPASDALRLGRGDGE